MDGGPPGRRKPTEPELRRILTLVGLGLIGLYLLLFVVLNTGKVQVSFVVFSADVTGFTAADCTLTTSGVLGGALVTTVIPTASPAVYDVRVTGYTGAGTLSLEVVENAALDAAGNGNLPSGPSPEYLIGALWTNVKDWRRFR